MNDVLNFVIKINDLMSGGLQKIATTAQSVFKKVDDSIGRTQNKMRGAGNSVSELNKRLEALTEKRNLAVNLSEIRQANREIAALERQMNRLQTAGLNRNTGSGFRMPGWLSTAVVTGGIAAASLGIVKAGARAQQDLIGLTTFVGAKQAQAVYSQIQKDAAATPFGTRGLLSADRALISAGVSADKARLDVLGLANAIAATGGGDDELARMAQNMQQIKNAGQATAADVKQFGFAGINIYQLLADATGKTVKQTKDMVVTYDLLSFALRKAANEGGLYAGAMEAQSRSISGKWSTLLDNIDIAAAKISMSQSNAITALIDQLIGLTDRLPALAEQWTAGITTMVKGVISFVGSLISMAKWVYHNWEWLKYVAGALAAVYAAVKLATIITATYNGLMMWAAIRTTAFAVAETEAAVAATSLNAAMLAGPWGWAALAIAGVGVALTAVISKTNELKDATDKATDAMAKYKQANLPAGVKGSGGYYDAKFTNPLAGGKYVQDTSTFTYVPFMKDIHDTVGTMQKVFTGGKKWVPAAAENTQSAAVERLIQRLGVKSLPGNVAGFNFAAATANLTGSDTTGKYQQAIAEKGSGITSGGTRAIHISFRNVVENMINQGGDSKELIANMEPKLKEMLYRIVLGIPSN